MAARRVLRATVRVVCMCACVLRATVRVVCMCACMCACVLRATGGVRGCACVHAYGCIWMPSGWMRTCSFAASRSLRRGKFSAGGSSSFCLLAASLCRFLPRSAAGCTGSAASIASPNFMPAHACAHTHTHARARICTVSGAIHACGRLNGSGAHLCPCQYPDLPTLDPPIP